MQLVDRFPGKIIGPALKCLITLSAMIVIIITGNVYSQGLSIIIAEPKDGKQVCWRTMIRGSVSDPKLQVFVAIHPMAAPKFYIQPIPTMSSDGKWSAYCYFGEQDQGINEPFEIIALASKNKNLFKEGDILPSPLPDNQQILFRSNPVIVKRAPCLK